VNGVSFDLNKMLKLGLSPMNVLCSINYSGTPSFSSYSLVFPRANASGYAKKLDINSS
jgi:hypothetical protein